MHIVQVVRLLHTLVIVKGLYNHSENLVIYHVKTTYVRVPLYIRGGTVDTLDLSHYSFKQLSHPQTTHFSTRSEILNFTWYQVCLVCTTQEILVDNFFVNCSKYKKNNIFPQYSMHNNYNNSNSNFHVIILLSTCLLLHTSCIFIIIITY